MVIVIKFEVCKFKWSTTKRSSLKLVVHYGVNGLVKMCQRVALPEWSMSNQLVFIEPTQPRKVVQLEGVKIDII